MKIIRRNDFTQLINKRKYKIGVEIGVYKGIFSNYLLKESELDELPNH